MSNSAVTNHANNVVTMMTRLKLFILLIKFNCLTMLNVDHLTHVIFVHHIYRLYDHTDNIDYVGQDEIIPNIDCEEFCKMKVLL